MVAVSHFAPDWAGLSASAGPGHRIVSDSENGYDVAWVETNRAGSPMLWGIDPMMKRIGRQFAAGERMEWHRYEEIIIGGRLSSRQRP